MNSLKGLEVNAGHLQLWFDQALAGNLACSNFGSALAAESLGVSALHFYWLRNGASTLMSE